MYSERGARVRELARARDLVALARELAEIDNAAGGHYGFWTDEEGYYILAPVRDMQVSDVIELIRQVTRRVRDSAAAQPRDLLGRLSQGLPDDALPSVCADWLTGVDRYQYSGNVGDELARMAKAFLASGSPLSPGIIAVLRRAASIPYSGKTNLAKFGWPCPASG